MSVLDDIRRREYEDFARRMGVSRQNRTSFNDLWWNPNERFRLTGYGTNVNNIAPYFSGSMGSLDFAAPIVDRFGSNQVQDNTTPIENISDQSQNLSTNLGEVNAYTPTGNSGGFNWLQTGAGALGTGVGLLVNPLSQSVGSAVSGGVARAAAKRAGETVAQFMPDVLPGAAPELIAGGAAKGFSSALGASSLSSGTAAGIGAAGALVGGLGKHFISDGYSNDVGNAIADIGGPVGGVIGYFNPVIGAIVSAATGIIGGAVNRGFSTKTDEAKLAKVNSAINYYNNANFKAKSFDDLAPIASFGFQNPYKSGWFKSASGKNRAIKNQFLNAKDFATRGQENAVKNLEADALSRELSTSAAYGGPLDIIDPSTAIGYSIHTDKFIKDKQKENSDMTNMFAGTPDIFGFGGGIYTKGANFDTGVSYINNGGTHEENPYEGVQMGVDSQGIPNLVEEGEVKWQDYMFSNRLIVPRGKRGNYGKRTRKYAEGGKLAKGKGVDVPYESLVLKPYEGLTFAEAAKKIIKKNGADERDDAITMRGVDAQLSVLAGIQEKERQKEELREMQEAIDNMSPEEFAMLQQYAEQQQAQQQQMENPMFMPQEGQMIPQEAAPMSAFGGQLYALGGPIAKVAKYHNLTEEQWNKLDETAQNNYIRRYQSSLKRADRKTFETEMSVYRDNLKKEKELADYREAQKNSTLTKDDIKNLTYEQKVKLGKALDPSFDANSYKTMNQQETLDDDLVKLSEKNKVTLGQLNETLAPSSAHKDWQIVNPDEAWSRSIDWNTPLYGENTPVPVEAGNTRGHYRPRNWVNGEGKIVVGDNTYDDMKSYELSDEYLKPRYELAKSAAAQDEAGKKLWQDYVAGLNPDYAASYDPSIVFGKDYAGSLQDYDTFKKYIQDNYETLNKANADGTRSGFFDQIAGQMHGTYGTKQARELYQIKGNEGTYLNPEGNWRDNYSIVNTENKDDGTTIYTLDPNAGMYFNRVEGTPEGLQVSPDGTITRTGNLNTDNDPFPKPSNWPYAAAVGLQLGSLGYNILKPADYSNADALLSASKDAGLYKPVEFRPIGNYLPYKPLDIWYEQNRLNANARATDRAILNSGANQGSKAAALLASGYNNQLASGNLFRQALEYNDALRKQVTDFNRGTDMFNSEGFLKADMANQDAASRAAGYTLEGKRAAYAMRQAVDDAKANAISAGLSGLGNLAMAYGQNKWNQDVLGWKLRHNQYPISQLEGYKYDPYTGKPVLESKGGKLKKRHRGLGF